MRILHRLAILSAIALAALGLNRRLLEFPMDLSASALWSLDPSTLLWEENGGLPRGASAHDGRSNFEYGYFEFGNFEFGQSGNSGLHDVGQLNFGQLDDGQLDDGQLDDGQLMVQEPSRRSARRPSLDNASKYNQRASYSMLKAFGEAMGSSWKSTVELLSDGQQLAYGAIVDEAGWIITKESQLPSQNVVCRFADGEESPVEIVDRSSSLDLALLRVPQRGLAVVQWSEENIPARGKWVATPNIQSIPAAVGVVSAGLMSISARKAVMGVQLDEDHGPIIRSVIYGSGADVAGLLPGDRIRSIDGRSLASQQAALEFLRTCRAGQSVKLTIQRGESEVETSVRMMDFSEDLRDETEMEVNGLISARSSGFSSIFMHDTVLKPNQCGGPLVDLNGRVVGINIARAGRVSSYALPAAVVRAEVDSMLSRARATIVTASVTTSR